MQVPSDCSALSELQHQVQLDCAQVRKVHETGLRAERSHVASANVGSRLVPNRMIQLVDCGHPHAEAQALVDREMFVDSHVVEPCAWPLRIDPCVSEAADTCGRDYETRAVKPVPFRPLADRQIPLQTRSGYPLRMFVFEMSLPE